MMEGHLHITTMESIHKATRPRPLSKQTVCHTRHRAILEPLHMRLLQARAPPPPAALGGRLV